MFLGRELVTGPARCALCLEVATLCRSHIIPEFLYSSVYYGPNHRYEQLSTIPGTKKIHRQTGIFEHLLCGTCEGRFGKWESYAAQVVNGGSLELEYREIPGGSSIRPVDYRTLKLFGLSMLWRAGVTTRPEFKHVALGPHAERLRLMLLRDEPGAYWEYGFLLNFPPDQSAREAFSNAIIFPESIKINGHHGHRFVLGVTTWIFFASNHMRAIDKRMFSLMEDGELILRSGGSHMVDFLGRFAVKITDAQS